MREDEGILSSGTRDKVQSIGDNQEISVPNEAVVRRRKMNNNRVGANAAKFRFGCENATHPPCYR